MRGLNRCRGSEMGTHHMGLGLSMMLAGELSARITISKIRGLQMRRERALQCRGHCCVRGRQVSRRRCVKKGFLEDGMVDGGEDSLSLPCI